MSALSPEEKKLLQQIAQSDEEAFDALFKQYYQYLMTIAYNFTHDYNLSKDLIQEVFLDIWKRRTSLVIKGSLRYFLKGATINQCLSALNKKKTLTEFSEAPPKLKTELNAQSEIELHELNKKIRSIIEELPEKCREIFLLSRFENLSHKEIAEKLNISTKTIENHITRALKILRKALEEDRLIASAIFLILIFI